MLSVVRQRLMDIRSSLWFRPASFCFGVILLCVGIPLTAPWLPDAVADLVPHVERETVVTLLQVLAGSMLTVTTVTLSVLMLALGLAVAHATSRAVPELMADPTTQNALGTFLAAFVFSLGGLFLLGIGAVGERATALVYFVALLLVAGAVIYLMQWIHHVAGVIRINKVVSRIHLQSKRVLTYYLSHKSKAAGDSFAGRRPGEGDLAVYPCDVGYVQLIDIAALDRIAAQHDLTISLCLGEGAFALPRAPAMWVADQVELGEDVIAQLASAVVVGSERSAASDPLLGIELLAEVAARALSSGVNDPQTALVCIDYLSDLLLEAATVAPSDYPASRLPNGRIWLQRPGFDAMLERAYRPIMRDAADSAEVLFAVVDALSIINRHCHPVYREQICGEARRALDFGLAFLHYEDDKRKLTAGVEALTS